ncbi:transposase [Malikia spinosa]|uniref:Transposase n=1 Tax=Malikia spinosa TaxID=86180 RepID=A0A7C9MQG4_9BURK|nr:transposase [Malikia spinosa]MYZ50878.1 transposase [Malikia spinosa]
MNTNFAQLPGGRQRGPHEFQASVIEACLQPGVSIAAVALANGFMRWRCYFKKDDKTFVLIQKSRQPVPLPWPVLQKTRQTTSCSPKTKH